MPAAIDNNDIEMSCKNKLVGLQNAEEAFKKVDEIMGDETLARFIYAPGEYIEVEKDRFLFGLLGEVYNVYLIDSNGDREITAQFIRDNKWFKDDEYRLQARYDPNTYWRKIGSNINGSSLKWNTSAKYIAFLTGTRVEGNCESF